MYANTSAQDDDVTAVANFLRDALDQIFNDSIEYYEITVYNGYLQLPDDTKGTFFNQFGSWFQNTTTNHSSTTTYSDYSGCHMGISGSFNGGVAWGGTNTSYNYGRAAVTGVLSGVKEHYGNIAIQECFHTIIRDDLPQMDGLIEDEEHDLGIIYSDGSVSPMATSYEGDLGSTDHAHHGSCDPNNAFVGTYKRQLTSCTIDAARYTSNEAN